MDINEKYKIGGLTLGFLIPSYYLFLFNPVLSVGVATISVVDFVNTRINMPPVLAALSSFLLFGLVMFVSWYCAEVVMILAALAMAKDVMILLKTIARRTRRVTSVNKATKAMKNTTENFVIP